MATVRAFAERSGAQQVLVLIDRGEEATPTMLEWRAGRPLELTDEGITWEVPDDIAAEVEPLPLNGVRRAPPASSLRIDSEAGLVEGPIGAVEALCDAVRELAEAFGSRSVASADWASAQAETPFTIAARSGEPAVLGVGDEMFELPGRPR